MPFQNDIQNQGSGSNPFVKKKYQLFKRDDMQMTEYILIRRTLSMTLHCTILSPFLSTRNLRIDKTIR